MPNFLSPNLLAAFAPGSAVTATVKTFALSYGAKLGSAKLRAVAAPGAKGGAKWAATRVEITPSGSDKVESSIFVLFILPDAEDTACKGHGQEQKGPGPMIAWPLIAWLNPWMPLKCSVVIFFLITVQVVFHNSQGYVEVAKPAVDLQVLVGALSLVCLPPAATPCSNGCDVPAQPLCCSAHCHHTSALPPPAPQPTVEYVVRAVTGDVRGADASGCVELKIVGDKGTAEKTLRPVSLHESAHACCSLVLLAHGGNSKDTPAMHLLRHIGHTFPVVAGGLVGQLVQLPGPCCLRHRLLQGHRRGPPGCSHPQAHPRVRLVPPALGLVCQGGGWVVAWVTLLLRFDHCCMVGHTHVKVHP